MKQNLLEISIHAPTWGATRIALRSFSDFPISIHAPTWGATFTPTLLSTLCGISIHAPTWGATDVGECCAWAWAFQSTHPRGVRPMDIKYLTGLIYISIHAPTWGATPDRKTSLGCWQYFNPRTHVGCDRMG